MNTIKLGYLITLFFILLSYYNLLNVDTGLKVKLRNYR